MFNLSYAGLLGINTILTVFPAELYTQSHDLSLNEETRETIERLTKTIAQRLRITKNIELIPTRLTNSFKAVGTTLFPGKVGIIFNSTLAAVLPNNQLEFLLAHELCHIQSNDPLKIFSFAALTGVITLLCLNKLFPSLQKPAPFIFSIFLKTPSQAAALGFVTSYVALIEFSKKREEAADKRAFSICSEEGKKGAIAFFETQKQLILAGRESATNHPFLIKKIVHAAHTEEGNLRTDFLHPPITTRIAYLKELQATTRDVQVV